MMNHPGFDFQTLPLLYRLPHVEIQNMDGRWRQRQHGTVARLAVVPQCEHPLSAEEHHVTGWLMEMVV